jgi:hypothetical protein
MGWVSRKKSKGGKKKPGFSDDNSSWLKPKGGKSRGKVERVLFAEPEGAAGSTDNDSDIGILDDEFEAGDFLRVGGPVGQDPIDAVQGSESGEDGPVEGDDDADDDQVRRHLHSVYL